MKTATEDTKQNILSIPLEVTPAMFKQEKINGLVDQIVEQCGSIVLDGSTPKGRKECISLSAKIKSTKVVIDDAGKEEKAEFADAIKKIDSQRKDARDRLDDLAKAMRKPATDWEVAEATRIKGHRSRIQKIQLLRENTGGASVISLEESLHELNSIYAEKFEEYQSDADTHYTVVKEVLEGAIVDAKVREDEKAELERLRKLEADKKIEDEKREKEERDKQIAEEAAAAERAKIEEEKEPAPPPPEPDPPIEAAPAPAASDPGWRPAPPEMKKPTIVIGREQMRLAHSEIVAALVSHSNLDEETAKSVVVAVARKQIPRLSIQY